MVLLAGPHIVSEPNLNALSTRQWRTPRGVISSRPACSKLAAAKCPPTANGRSTVPL